MVRLMYAKFLRFVVVVGTFSFNFSVFATEHYFVPPLNSLSIEVLACRYSVGVCPTIDLNTLLNVDLALKPECSAISNTVFCKSELSRYFAYSTLRVLTNS